MFTGSMVAIITPFRAGRVDEEAFKKLIEFQIENGTDCIVPCGTTGESATLSVTEHHQVVKLAVTAAQGRVPIIAGTGSNNTEEAIELTQAAKKAGANGSLLITPYYNKPTQEGVYQHFMAIAKATEFPFILYNIQSRTGINVLPETIVRLADDCSWLKGVKEASGNVEQISQLHSLLGDRSAILSGDDALTLPIMAVGGAGVISVIANIAPRQTKDLVKACQAGKYLEARKIHEKMLPLVKTLFLESNPSPIKAALEILGLCSSEVRLPLVPVTTQTRIRLEAELKKLGLEKREVRA